MPAFLTSCGGGSSDSSAPTAPPVQAAKTDVAYVFKPEDPRLVRIKTADGFTLTYYGTKDSGGNVTSVTDFYYSSTNQALPDFQIHLSPTSVTVVFQDGGKFDFFQIGLQYQVRWRTAAGQSYLAVFDPTNGSELFEDDATSGKATSISATTAAAIPPMLANASDAHAVGGCAFSLSQAAQQALVPTRKDTGTGTQTIVVTVNDRCGVVSTGSVTAEVKLGTFYDTGDVVSTGLISDPPITKQLKFSDADQAFVGDVSLSQLNTVSQAVKTEVASIALNQATEKIKDYLTDKVMDEALLPLAARVVDAGGSKEEIKQLAENTGTAMDLWETAKKLFAVNPLTVAEVLGDATHAYLAGGANKLFPITVNASYSGDPGVGSGSTMVDVPGETPANISVSVDAAGPCSNGNLAGDWFGTVVDVENIGWQYYELKLTVIGNTVVGTSRAGTPSGQYFAEKNLTGQLSGNAFNYSETAITSQLAPPGHFWCLLNAALTLSEENGTQTLNGNWVVTTPGCLNGVINLTRRD